MPVLRNNPGVIRYLFRIAVDNAALLPVSDNG